MRFSIILLLTVLFSVSNAMCEEGGSGLKENTFVMAFARPETQYFGKWQRLVHTEIFKRLGIKVEFRDYTPKRVGMESDAEIIKAMKAEGVIEQYRNMLDKEFGFVRK